MAVEVILPKVDMVMETGTFVEWLKEEGQQVVKGEPLFTILTDKAAIEIESPASGTLAGVSAKPDDVIPVSATIAFILAPGERQPERRTGVFATSDVAGAATPAIPTETPAGAVVREPAGFSAAPAGKVRASPVARRMAAESGLNLNTLSGRGPRGRIQRADVAAAVETRAVIRPSGMPAFQIPLPEARRKEVIPLAGARKIIAQRMAYSAAVAPHITLTVSVDMTEPSRLRSYVQNSLEQKTGYRLSYTAIIAWVVAKALGNHPFLNASLDGDKIVVWEDVNLGIATNIDDYLVVPVIREAQTKTLEGILLNLGDLLERARSRKLSPSEMSGSTFTISNMGMYGIESFTAIINPPESAILAIGSIVDTYVKVGQAMIEKPLMKLTICADHRVVDGVAAANFINEVKNTLENPYLLI